MCLLSTSTKSAQANLRTRAFTSLTSLEILLVCLKANGSWGTLMTYATKFFPILQVSCTDSLICVCKLSRFKLRQSYTTRKLPLANYLRVKPFNSAGNCVQRMCESLRKKRVLCLCMFTLPSSNQQQSFIDARVESELHHDLPLTMSNSDGKTLIEFEISRSFRSEILSQSSE
jgi:hypothetical protein